MWPFTKQAAVGPEERHEGEVYVQIDPVFNQTANPLREVHKWDKFGNDGYRLNSVMRACVVELATSIAQVRLVVERRAGGRRSDEWEEVAPNHPLRRLLQNPNPSQTTFDWVEEMITDLYVFGNQFSHKIRTAAGPPGQLENLRPHRVEVMVNEAGNVVNYKVQILGATQGIGSATSLATFKQRTLAVDAVSHMKLPDPINEFIGLAPIVSALRAGDMDDRAQDYLRTFFLNAGTPQGLLKFKTRVSPHERERIKQSWHAQQTGQGRHSTAVLDADVDYEEVGTRPDKLKLDQIFDITESRLCMAFGVPPIVIGVRLGLLRSTYANYEGARTSLWQETLAPMYLRLGERLTKDIATEFSSDDVEHRVRFDLSEVEELQRGKESRREFSRLGWEIGLLTRNEARDLVDLPPLAPEIGDVVRVKNTETGLTPVDGDKIKQGEPSVDMPEPPAPSGNSNSS